MDVILHLGAHGTATRHFQAYAQALAQSRVGSACAVLGPEETGPDPASKIISVERAGMHAVLISDADILGSLTDNLEAQLLYARAGARVADFVNRCGGRISRLVLSPRSLDLYWCAAVSNGVAQGAGVPGRAELHRVATANRSWRDVIADIASAVPAVEIRVLPFERYAGMPHRFLADAVDLDVPRIGTCAPREAAPLLPELRRVLRERAQDATSLPFGMGRWNPFTNEEHAALRELYADDMMWLTAGADGLATLLENCPETRAGQTPPSVTGEKGRNDELEKREMARPG